MREATQSRSERWLKAGGFILGLGMFGIALLAWRVPAGTTVTGAEVSLTTMATGELAVTPVGAILRTTDLRPSARSRGTATRLTVRNQTAGDLDVSLRASVRTRDLDALLRVEIATGGRPLFAGPLAELRRWTRRSFRLRSGASQRLGIRTWIPKYERTGYEAGVADISLEFRVRPTGTKS